ncbi:ERCC4 domain-containing protein [Pelomicrobium sp. G1]|uniref:ERCC4 domain-containing protein n=1 Tax=unclassified Pelomicrobium TaxID=2815318 RepID=UPI003F762098
MRESSIDSRKPIPIVVDDREQSSSLLPLLLESAAFEVRVERLKLGDYQVDGRFLFERKTLSDLVLSIEDGRLFNQALRFAQAKGLRPALVLEGTSKDLGGHGMAWEAIQGALVTVCLFIGLPVLRTRSPAETVRTFLYVARQGRTLAHGALPRRGWRPKGKAALQRYLLQGLPGIGPARATRLLERFGTVERILTASEGELASVAGIGTHTARRIRWAVEEPGARYEPRFAAEIHDRPASSSLLPAYPS